MAKKEEGKIQDCWQCGEEITCRSVEYQGNTTLQWQNEDGKSHYKFISDGKYECRTSHLPSTVYNPSETIDEVAFHAEQQKLETGRLADKLEELSKSPSFNVNGAVPNVIKLYIETLHMCDYLGITDEIKRGMIFNNVIRRSMG